MTGWHHQLDGHGFGWTPGVGDRQGGLAGCSSWGSKEKSIVGYGNTDQEYLNECVHGSKTDFMTS